MRHVVRKYDTVEQEIEASEVRGLPHEWGASASAELSERPVLSVVSGTRRLLITVSHLPSSDSVCLEPDWDLRFNEGRHDGTTIAAA